MNKFELLSKVAVSQLAAEDKMLLTELIIRADDKGECFPSVQRLCQVRGIRHEKNFKGVDTYLPGLVTTERRGRKNYYILNTPAIEGLLPLEVDIKHTPAVEGVLAEVDTPASEGVLELDTPALEDNTPAVEGVNTPAVADNTPAQEGANSTLDNTYESTKDSTGAPESDDSLFVGIQEDAQIIKHDAEPSFVENKTKHFFVKVVGGPELSSKTITEAVAKYKADHEALGVWSEGSEESYPLALEKALDPNWKPTLFDLDRRVDRAFIEASHEKWREPEVVPVAVGDDW